MQNLVVHDALFIACQVGLHEGLFIYSSFLGQVGPWASVQNPVGQSWPFPSMKDFRFQWLHAVKLWFTVTLLKPPWSWMQSFNLGFMLKMLHCILNRWIQSRWVKDKVQKLQCWYQPAWGLETGWCYKIAISHLLGWLLWKEYVKILLLRPQMCRFGYGLQAILQTSSQLLSSRVESRWQMNHRKACVQIWCRWLYKNQIE